VWDGYEDCSQSQWAYGNSMEILNGCEFKLIRFKHGANAVADVSVSQNSPMCILFLRIIEISDTKLGQNGTQLGYIPYLKFRDGRRFWASRADSRLGGCGDSVGIPASVSVGMGWIWYAD